MKTKSHQKNIFRSARIFAVLLAGIILIPMLRAQPTEQTVQSRFLLVFDTSSDMKKRVDAVQKALNMMLATSMGGQLHSGDSIGVWTFDHDLRGGDKVGFATQGWNPDNAVSIASDIMKAVRSQRFGNSTHFEAFIPLVNRIVENSERLTVLVFCDGETEFGGTPFDDAINGIFQEKQGERKKANQPFVIVLRSQLGKYVAATVELPPVPVSLPQFPPLPEPPPPAPKVTNTPPPAPAIVIPSLIIIGTNTANKTPPPENNPPQTNIPPVQQTNAAVFPPTNPVPQTVGPTNAPASPPESSSAGGKRFLAAGAAIFAVAAVLGIFAWRRSRRTGASLITRSMNDRR